MYSVNQVKQLYVIGRAGQTITSASTKGDLSATITSNNGEYIYWKYMSAGGPMATDRIKKCKVKWISVTDAEAMRKPLRTWTIKMNSNVNSGNPVVGEDYIVSFDFKHYFGMSDEDAYFKQAAARAFTTTASDLIWALASSLAKNFSREIDKPFKIEVKYSSTYVEVTPTSEQDTSKTYTEIRLTELIQPWELGRYKLLQPDFTINFVPVTISGVDNYKWGTVTEGTSSGSPSYIGNGMETADFEWFCMGERGDQYRGKDWPLSITTPATLMVDPTKEYNYLIVHFWDDIDNEGPQKSERDLIFLAEKKVSGGVDLEGMAAAIAAAVGLDGYTVDGEYTPVETESDSTKP